MRTITKRVEPASLARYRASGNTSYEDYRDKDALRNSLANEQRGLCCYCLSPIRPERAAMRIEHWHSQRAYPAETLDYANLLGACLGGEGQPWTNQHCDVRKGDKGLSRNPANPMPRVEDLIHFLGDGRITSDDPIFDHELNDVLNLNVAFLKNNRKATLDAFKIMLNRRGSLHRTTLGKWMREWNGDAQTGDLRPFCQVVVYWLQKRLARA